MENAGRQTALIIQHLFPDGPVAALVGSGNNGGDALVCLRCLAAWGRSVTAVMVGSRPAVESVLHDWKLPSVRFGPDGAETGEAAAADPAGDSTSRVLREAAVVVDGLLGTGIRGAPRSRYAAAIEAANGAGGVTVALDAPSGVDGATGVVPGAVVQADLTVAFGWPKLGTLLHPGRMHCGRIVAVEPHDGVGETGRGSGLAAGAGSDEHDRRQLLQVLLHEGVDHARHIVGHSSKDS